MPIPYDARLRPSQGHPVIDKGGKVFRHFTDFALYSFVLFTAALT